MKNLCKFILISLSAILVISCDNKQEPCPENTSDIQIKIGLENGMLSFGSMEDFIFTYNYLENKQESYLDKFDSNTDEDLEINESLPLEEFERSKKFNSLRQKIESEIVKWLENIELDTLNDPDDHFVEDEILRTLITPDCKVLIGKKEYNLCDESFMDSENSTQLRSAANGCKLYLSEKKWCYYDNGKKRVKLKGSLRYYGIKSTLKAKVVSYKKKRNGNWKRHRTRLFVQSLGKQIDNRNGKCATQHDIGAFKGPKNRKKLVARYTKWGERIWCRKNDVAIGSTAGNGQSPCSFLLD